jgi:hypothetical protein
MNEVKETTDFSIFKGHDNNRVINTAYVRRLAESIKGNNLLRYRPILVDKDYKVLDGQHRLCAAKHLNVPIYYQMKDHSDEQDIVTLNIHQKSWTMEDWLNFHYNQGNPHYVNMKNFCIESGKTISSMFRIFQALAQQKSFKGGQFRFPSPEKIEIIKGSLQTANEIIFHVKPFMLSKESIVMREKFQEGLTVLLIEYPKIDIEYLKSKLIETSDAIRTCPNVDSYKQLIKEIYNYRRKITI